MFLSILGLLAFTAAGYAKYSGGSGTAEDPYQIATAADLIALGETPADYDKHFILMADIDLDPNIPGGKVFDKAIIAPDVNETTERWRFDGTPFTGIFDGNGHTISHLTIGSGGYVGLFGNLRWDAKVKNLGVVGVEITGSSWYVGGLAGCNWGLVDCCYSTGSVRGSGQSVGGLVGHITGGAVTHCYSTCAVSGGYYVGGLVGSNHGTVTLCYSTGHVSGTGEYIGGLVGTHYADVINSVWDTETSGLSGSAGGVGLTTAEMMDPYMLGLNGFASDPNWVLDAGHDYPRLAWEGTTGQAIPKPDFGWMKGHGTPEDPYRIETADQLILLGRAGTLLDKDFVLGADINLDPNLPNNRVFTQAVIPTFAGLFDGDDHTISHLTIKGTRYLGLFGHLGKGAAVKNLGVVDVNVVGSDRYVGGLVGYNGFGSDVIGCRSSGVVIGRFWVGGLAGANSGGSDMSHCNSNATVISTGECVGGLVGYNEGNMAHCWSTGSVSVTGPVVGGLVGENTGDIVQCYSAGTVMSTEFSVGGLVGENSWVVTRCCATGSVTGVLGDVGGLVGFNDGAVSQCYSTGVVRSDGSGVGGLVGSNAYEIGVSDCYSTSAVSGDLSVGGLVGSNDGDVTRCYSTGAVEGRLQVGGLVGTNYLLVTACLWNIRTSGQVSSDSGTGKTTAEMKKRGTFTVAGWDFVGESVNGTEDSWVICEGQDYPKLTWQFVVGDFDNDGDKDYADLSMLADKWLGTEPPSVSFWCGNGGIDLTDDKEIDFSDFAKFAENWLAGSGL